MKNNTSVIYVGTVICACLLMGCNSIRGKDNSRATGWEINSDEGGFQFNEDYDAMEAAPGMVYVEGGTFTMGRVQDFKSKECYVLK